jgi:hypothetical protein
MGELTAGASRPGRKLDRLPYVDCRQIHFNGP